MTKTFKLRIWSWLGLNCDTTHWFWRWNVDRRQKPADRDSCLNLYTMKDDTALNNPVFKPLKTAQKPGRRARDTQLTIRSDVRRLDISVWVWVCVWVCVLSPSRRTDKARRLVSRGSHNPAERQNVSALLLDTHTHAQTHTHTHTHTHRVIDGC